MTEPCSALYGPTGGFTWSMAGVLDLIYIQFTAKESRVSNTETQQNRYVYCLYCAYFIILDYDLKRVVF